LDDPDISELLDRAAVTELSEGTFFGEVPGAAGLWAMAETERECRAELQAALETWVESKRDGSQDTLVFMVPREDALMPAPVLERILLQLSLWGADADDSRSPGLR
jgi:predicted RNase H-like HicB family nuclease